MRSRKAVGAILGLAVAGAVAIPAWGFIHNAQWNQYTIQHGLYRGSSLTDGDTQVYTDLVTGGYSTSNAPRIALYHDDNRFYDYTCSNTSVCYHNHSSTYPECGFRGANQYHDYGVEMMSYHVNQDSDYCGP